MMTVSSMSCISPFFVSESADEDMLPSLEKSWSRKSLRKQKSLLSRRSFLKHNSSQKLSRKQSFKSKKSSQTDLRSRTIRRTRSAKVGNSPQCLIFYYVKWVEFHSNHFFYQL